MTTNILSDAFEHHLWANRQILDACGNLTPERLASPVPGTYGSIESTLHHLIQADSFYLWVYNGSTGPLIRKDDPLSIDELRAANDRHAGWYRQLLTGPLDPDEDVAEHGEGWDFVAKQGIRVAQIIHHGSDHRSQICTGLTALGIEPPEIDLWAYGKEVGRTREIESSAT
jgi:uncharacterized damage-inducible protein DinB